MLAGSQSVCFSNSHSFPPKSTQRSELEGSGWDWSSLGSSHTGYALCDQSPESSPHSSRENRPDALLMVPVNSPYNFPYRVYYFVQNQNCTSTEERFQRLSENVKKKVSGREVIAPLLIFVNAIFAAVNCPSVTLEWWLRFTSEQGLCTSLARPGLYKMRVWIHAVPLSPFQFKKFMICHLKMSW